MKTRTSKRVSNNLIAIAISLVMFIPIYLVIINSLKDDVQARSMGIELPRGFQWENYLTVIEEGKLVQAFTNSMLYASAATVLVVIFATAAAFVLSRNRSKLNRFLYFFLIMGIAMPLNFVTLTKVMQVTHLINTPLGIILLYAAIQLPLSIFIIYAFVETIPRELDEAAIIDGCGPMKFFFSVIFPLLTPAWVTAAILSFLSIWSEFLLPLYFLNSSDKWPMTLAVYNFFGMYEASWNLVSADIVLTILPVMIVYLLGQRYIVSGMTGGAVKG